VENTSSTKMKGKNKTAEPRMQGKNDVKMGGVEGAPRSWKRDATTRKYGGLLFLQDKKT